MPRMELDFILYSAGIEISSFEVPNVLHSDHLPLLCDFDLR
jgi:endonuclease/exonuclease/phosphatase family metal-dependent hydrolase